jgi:hypothetical protein
MRLPQLPRVLGVGILLATTILAGQVSAYAMPMAIIPGSDGDGGGPLGPPSTAPAAPPVPPDQRATPVTGTVVASEVVNVRAAPSMDAAVVATAANADQFDVLCYAKGDTDNSGFFGSNPYWDMLADPARNHRTLGYIADVWLDTGGDITTQIRECGTSIAAPPRQTDPAPASPPPGCGPQHTVGAFAASACLAVRTQNALIAGSGPVTHSEAYITTPGGPDCKVVFSMFHHNGSELGLSNLPYSETQPCKAGTSVQYVPGSNLLQNLIPSGGFGGDGNDLQLVVDVIDHGVTRVIADSPVQSDHGVVGQGVATTHDDTVSTAGPGDGNASTSIVSCHMPLPAPTGFANTIDVSVQAHLNDDGTVSHADTASGDNPSVSIGGINTVATVRDSNTFALIANGGHSLELHTHATVQYGIPVKEIAAGVPIGIDCNAYYTF